MTTINTSDDLLTLLRENQEFREAARQAILTEELLTLPARFNAFVSEMRDFVSEMRNYIKVTDERLERLEEGQRRLEEGQHRLEERQQRLEEGQQRLEERQQRLEEGQQRLEEGQQRLESGQHGHTNDIGMLKGFALETKLYNRGIALVATRMKLRNGRRVRVAEVDDNSDEFNNALYQALNDGTLSEAEYHRILDTDMILSGMLPGSSDLVYIAIETTYTVSRVDIYKVKETAAILGRVFHGVEILVALYYVNIMDMFEDEANQQGVHLIKARNLVAV
jgi:exonuclease VII small subunit